MSVSEHPQFAGHEAVVFLNDHSAGLRAIVAVHSTARGPAFGGCRMRAYASEDDALHDVLRLSQGMSYKNALAGLPFGGGKAVIIGDPATAKTPALLRAFGRRVDQLGGTYVTAEDSNVNTADIAIVGEATRHIRNLPLDESGNPSVITAWGVFQGLKAALRYQGCPLDGATVIVEGLGSVGMDLAALLHEAGAKLVVSDIDGDKVAEAARRFGAAAAALGRAHAAEADVYAPCALGGTLNERTIPEIRARIVAGAANNQLATPEDGARLKDAGILYCPDYVVNAGGVLSVVPPGTAYSRDGALRRADGIAATVTRILQSAAGQGVATNVAADQLAERLLVRP